MFADRMHAILHGPLVRRVFAAATVTVFAAGILAGCAASHATGSPPRSSPTQAGAAATHRKVGKVVGQIPVGVYPDGILAGFGSLWTANLNADSVSRIDPATRRVVATISVAGGPIRLLAADGAVWVVDYNDSTLTRIDPQTNRTSAIIRVGSKPQSLAMAGDALWVFNQGDFTASVVDMSSLRARRTIRIGVAAGFVAVHDGLLWVPDFVGGSRKLLALDTRTGKAVRTVAVGTQPVQVGFGFGSGWVGNGPGDTVTRFDPATGAVVRTIATPGDAGGLVVADRAVWIASFLTNGVSKISPATNSVVGTLSLPAGSEPNGIVWLDGYLWVTESGSSEVAVIRPS